MERKNAWNTYDENAMKELEQVTEAVSQIYLRRKDGA